MNFISHYYLVRLEKNPHYTLGNILPDLAKVVHKNLRIQEKNLQQTEIKAYSNISKGIIFHHYTDLLFHRSAFFHTYTDLINKELKAIEFELIVKYKYFIAHIMLEIILDKILIIRNNHLCDDFYNELTKVKKETILNYFTLIKKEKLGPRFYYFFDQFRKEQYIRQYLHNENIIFALGRVYQRVTGIDFSEKDKQKLLEVLKNSIKIVDKDYLSAFKY